MDEAELSDLKTLADLPSALVDEVCYGMATLPEIFVKFGYTPESAELFRDHSLFKKLIAVRSAELEKEGLTHKVRAGMVADSALMELAKRVTDRNTTTAVLLDAYKAVSKNGGLEPRGAEIASAGAGFQINIIMPPPKVGTSVPSVVIDVTPVRVLEYVESEFEIVE